ncbi:Unconventional myosin-Va [Bagarius yarrelli]|uniref:Unconventional myosin-Va n=1 Tax=Bagarius yarrelli TaxID=175774 RepID=A0A556TS20_BAGYA|nr:Unconventional myosin-Va [Bagarius yarrelli]
MTCNSTLNTLNTSCEGRQKFLKALFKKQVKSRSKRSEAILVARKRQILEWGVQQAHMLSPAGKKFRSKPQLVRYLGNSMDLSSFDFRTGKMVMNKLNKNRQRLRYDTNSQTKGKPDLNTSLPVRQTASIFKQPVTKVTNHPSNKVKTDPQKAVDQPRQLFWEKKLSGLNAFDIAEELVKTMDLPKGLQGVGPGCTDKTLLSAIASALHTSSAPITGQLSAAVEKNPGVWLNTAQPLCKAFIVTDEDIRKQEELVYNVRKRLEEALMADMLAHVEETSSAGEAIKDEGNCHDDKEEQVEYPVMPPAGLPPLGNPDILEGENDLTALTFLHEPAVLHNLRVRFLHYNSIYTYCGIVLVALNPYEQLPIYGEEVIDAYSGQDMADMDPHIFSIAEDAYRTMIREEKNQSIIISGESGSGKTVSAKFTMRYFAVVGGAAQQTSIEEKVLASNPIMEVMRTLSFEFTSNAEHFRYTNQGLDADIAGTDDAMELEHTRNALTILGFPPDQQMEFFQILAAVLHLGNINIQASGRGERSYINTDDRSLVIFSKLMGVEGPQMAHWLCHQRLAVGRELLVKPMSAQKANEARDALAKHVYGQLFTWTVQRLNSTLRAHREQPKTFIGVLDIYGFETFDKNSFEQFCINYANEKLQQQFTKHVFQLEQEEYEREELPWNRIEFSDNQLCITLIEGSLGLLDLLDEECRIPKGSDENWAQKLYEQHLNRSPNFHKPRMSNAAFIVLHFADMVQYECEGFLDKNRDTVFEEPINIMRASQSELVAELFQQESTGAPLSASPMPASVHAGKRAQHKLTVAFQFRQSLQLLMDTLNNTTPHYVRCIKPNDLKQPFLFDPKRAVQQLRACGVLETIRISAAGYPSRQSLDSIIQWTYEDFSSRYRVLLHVLSVQEDLRASCCKVIPALIPDPEQYCFGKTKIFFRAGQVAVLEKLRAERLRTAAVTIQGWMRGWIQRRHYLQLRQATLILQRYTRGTLARRLAWALKYTRAALVIQKTYRMIKVRQRYLTTRKATRTIQAFTRGMQARRTFRMMLMERATVYLQSWVRCWLAQRQFRRVRAAVVLMQCCVRRRAARIELGKLRAEARSVERYRELNKGMEVKLMQLQLRADQQARASASLHESLRTERESHHTEMEQLRSSLFKLQKQLQEQSEAVPSVTAIQEEARKRTEEKAAQRIYILTQELETLKVERDSLKNERDALATLLSEQEKIQEENRQQLISQAGEAVQAELEEERRRYQGLLREFTRLEQRYDNLRDMSMLSTAEHSSGHKRSDSIQSVSLDPVSPISPSFGSFPDFSSSEESRRISVTSPFDRRAGSTEAPLNALMEDLGVSKNTGGKLQGEDLLHAYNAVRVANKFLESQLLAQRSEQEQEKSALTQKLQKATSRDAPVTKELKELMEQMEVQDHECYRLRRELKELKHTHLNLSLTGLLECRKRDESKLIKNLITDVRVDVALSLAPGLAACILFLCVQQADRSRAEDQARSISMATVTGIKAALKKHSDDLDMTALWLKNAYLLKDLLTQHSPKQMAEREEDVLPLQVELKEQVRMLSDVCIQAYQQLLSISESRLQPIIVPAMLESETIPGLSGAVVRLANSRKRAASDPRLAASSDGTSMTTVLRELGALHTALVRQELPFTLLEQAFRQLTHLLTACALNSLLLRKDMCCWNRGLLIRYNISLLEEWLRSRGLQTGGATATLKPLIQAAQLLQMSKKSEADGRAIVETCNTLSSQQVMVKLLSQYTPQSDAEERVTLNFIRIVQGLLKERADGNPTALLLDIRRVFPVTFPHTPPPPISVEQLHIPEALKINFLRRV